jgi:hypothetical protein
MGKNSAKVESASAAVEFSPPTEFLNLAPLLFSIVLLLYYLLCVPFACYGFNVTKQNTETIGMR